MADNAFMGILDKKTLDRFKEQHKDKIFKASEALSFGLSRWQLDKLVKQEEFIRLGKGYYSLKDYTAIGLDAQFRDLSTMIQGKSAVCLVTALVYYGLSDSVISSPWFMVEQGAGTSLKSVYFFRKRNPHWEVGIIEKDGFWITSVARTIVECIAYKKIVGYEGIYALRRAISNKKVRLPEIYEMGKQLGYSQRIKGIVEAYLDEGA